MGLHVAVIGGGMVGRVHLEALSAHPAVDTLSLAECDLATATQAAQHAALKHNVPDYRRLLDDPDIDVVDICLPHDQHYPLTLEALAAGKHVLLEKPISNTLAEADAMIAAAQSAGKRLYVALNERFLPVHQRAHELLQSGAIGRPILAVLTIAGSELARMQLPGHWKGTFGRAGGGALADSGTHLFDLAHFFFGPPQSITCQLERSVVTAANKGDDTACATLHFPGLLVNLAVTYASAGQPWTELRQVWGENGAVHIRLEDAEPLQVWQGGHQIAVPVAHNPDWWPTSVKLGLQHAMDCFANDQPFDVTPEDARQVLKTVRMAYHSARTGQLVTWDSYCPGPASIWE